MTATTSNTAPVKGLFSGILLLTGLAISGCDHGPLASTAEINQHIGSKVIVPRFEQAATQAQLLDGEINSWCAASANATNAASKQPMQDAWRAAFESWQAASVFIFGPLSEERRLRIAFFPDARQLVENRVDALLADTAPPNIANASAPVQGYPALEYLLFGSPPSSPNTCLSLQAIASHLAFELEQLALAWPAYVDQEFAVSGDAGLTALVESITRAVVTIRDDELGVPLGNSSGNAAKPALATSPYAQASINAMQAQLSSLLAILNGAGGPGLAHRIRTLGGGNYSDDVVALIQQTSAALGRIELPFGAALTDTAARVDLYAIFDGSFRQLRNQIQDLGGAVGVTPGFNASDGD